ncbi:hypothetical protein H8B06_08525 [Sphingobacterium sp. DN00404]|uniref:NVEALA family protein n=1 Tax=Sphingobacterium micropteri TaxID=2763501 RepID=A0ABR7YNH5_9SPHI|nr:NVEALA domain-containing protein [Sphingobacterium micropteri]MBD1432866.1 hypothetical protein [Sphingobacterium micropteri]
MKKKILGGIVAVAITAVAAVNVNFNNESEDALSALSLANVEALADGEEPDKGVTCDGSGSVTCPLDGTLVHKVTIWG